MSAVWTVSYYCSAPGCANYTVVCLEPTPDACEEAARAQGWEIPGDGHHYCQEHADD